MQWSLTPIDQSIYRSRNAFFPKKPICRTTLHYYYPWSTLYYFTLKWSLREIEIASSFYPVLFDILHSFSFTIIKNLIYILKLRSSILFWEWCASKWNAIKVNNLLLVQFGFMPQFTFSIYMLYFINIMPEIDTATTYSQ